MTSASISELKNVRIVSVGVFTTRFAAQIEKSVHDQRYARALAESNDQLPVERLDFFWACCTVLASNHQANRVPAWNGEKFNA
jgi:hypothetical protein